MKSFLFTLLIVSASFASAQCPFVSCRDSLAATVTTGSVAINSGFSNPTYTIISGPGTISGAMVSGLKPGATTVIQLVANTPESTVVAVKVITVAPVPVIIPKPRSVIMPAFDGKQWTFKFDSGPDQIL